MKENNYYCDMCGKHTYIHPTHIKKYEKNYCSEECSRKGCKENYQFHPHKKYKIVKQIKCDWCGGITEKAQFEIDKAKNLFCCRQCRDEFFKYVTSKSEETRQRSKKVILKNLKDGIIKTDSSIQLIINQLLDSVNIRYVNEYIIDKKYAVDNYLIDCDLIIEVQGNYWHSNPKIFSTINYDSQRRIIKSDKSKHTFIKKYRSIEILYLWEDDINNNIDLCKNLILTYIQNKGKLFNYESFNYSLINNRLILNSKIIRPYREYLKEDINAITDLSVKQKPEYYITFNCDICKKETTQLICVYNKNKHHYCSRECKDKGNSFFNVSKKIKFNCDYCGKENERYESQYNINKTHFCNPKCRGLYVSQEESMTCENCGREIKVTQKQKRLYKHHFCSYECNLEYKRRNKKNNS